MHSHSPSEKSSPLRAVRVVGSVVTLDSLDLAASPEVAEHCDLVEFRADALRDHVPAVFRAMTSCPAPCLLTVRATSEGGSAGDFPPEVRDKIFTALLPAAQGVDIEISSLSDFKQIVEQAKSRGIWVVASFHDFAGTPDRAVLEHKMAQAGDAGADAVKFATTLRNTADLAILAALQESATIPLATMGMGPLGRVSRLLLATLGSVLNYGYLDRPTVPGQWPAQRLRSLVRELRGEESLEPPPHI